MQRTAITLRSWDLGTSPYGKESLCLCSISSGIVRLQGQILHAKANGVKEAPLLCGTASAEPGHLCVAASLSQTHEPRAPGS